MLFQALDNKKECHAIFCDGDIYRYPNDLDLTHTWSYSPHITDNNIECAQIWCLGTSLDDICPEHLKTSWHTLSQKARAFITSFHEAKINLDDICFYDSVPKKFLLEYFSVKNKITDWVFNHHKKPKNYQFLYELTVLLDKIKKQKLNLRTENLDFIELSNRAIFNKIKHANNYIEYTPWVTATGRLTTTKNSFPILTLNKELRSIIVPRNDLFIELDYNSAELRTLFGLLGTPQPYGDIHSWVGKNIFNDKYTREQTKKRVFAWLYNPRAKNSKLSKHFNRDLALKKYYFNNTVTTPFDRTLKVQEDKALNYLIQSTASDLFLASMLETEKLLKNRKSFTSFCIHDSLVIDFAREDQPIINDLVKKFSNTKFGNFKTNLSIGKNFGAMKKI